MYHANLDGVPLHCSLVPERRGWLCRDHASMSKLGCMQQQLGHGLCQPQWLCGCCVPMQRMGGGGGGGARNYKIILCAASCGHMDIVCLCLEWGADTLIVLWPMLLSFVM